MRRRRDSLEPLWRAVHAVAFAEAGRLERNRAVVVERRAPEHRAMGHHALADLKDLVGVAVGGAAAQVGDPQVAGVHEASEFGRFVIQERIRADRIARGAPGFGKPGPDVGPLLVVGRGVAAVAIDAAEPDRLGLAMRLVLSPVARDAAAALGGGRCVGLPREVDSVELWPGTGNGTGCVRGPHGSRRRHRRAAGPSPRADRRRSGIAEK